MQTHRYLVEPLGGEHAYTMLITRFVKFLQNIKKSPKLAAQLMLQKVYNNVNTMTGKNVRMIKDIIGHDHDLLLVKPDWLRRKIRFSEMGEDDTWRVHLIREIVNIQQGVAKVAPIEGEDSFLTKEEFEEILEFVSIS